MVKISPAFATLGGNLWWINQHTEEVDWEAEAVRIEADLHHAAESKQLDYVHETLMKAMKKKSKE